MNGYVQNIDKNFESVTRCLKEENALDSTLLTVKSGLKSMTIKRKSLVIT